MKVKNAARDCKSVAAQPTINQHPDNPDRLLTTGQVATHTSMSESWLCKGRLYGWGPKFIRLGTAAKGGAVRYRWSDVLTYIASRECDPEADHNA